MIVWALVLDWMVSFIFLPASFVFTCELNRQGFAPDSSLAFKLAHDTFSVQARGWFSKGFWPTLPEPSETFVAEVLAVVREVRLRDEGRNGAVRNLRVRVGRSHDAVHIADHDRANLKRAKLAVTAFGMIVSAGFDLDKGGQKQWMHNLILVCVIFLGFTARIANDRFRLLAG